MINDTIYPVKDIYEQIYEATIKFLLPLETRETYKMITEEGMKLVDAKYATIFLAKKNELKRVYTAGPTSYKVKPRKDGHTYTVFKTGEPKIISITDFEKAHPEAVHRSVKTIFIVPLTNQGKVIGVFNLHSNKSNFNKSKILRALKLYGSLASLGIRKAQLYKEMEDALYTRDLFISITSHELRTPLTTINGYAQLINQKLTKGEMPKKEWAETLQYETLRLRRLTNELLQVDQIKSGEFQYQFRNLSVVDVIKHAVKEIMIKSPKNKIVINTEISKIDAVTGDFDKLLQVFINILNNSVKYSPPEKNIEISVKETTKFIIAAVKDHGNGIPSKDKKHIFEEFFKGSNAKSSGIGMGLFISKKIIDDHKGIIRIKSKKNEGTSVIIYLPKTI